MERALSALQPPTPVKRPLRVLFRERQNLPNQATRVKAQRHLKRNAILTSIVTSRMHASWTGWQFGCNYLVSS